MSALASSLEEKILLAFGFVRRDIHHNTMIPDIINIMVEYFSDPIIITIFSTKIPNTKERNTILSSIRDRIQKQCNRLLPEPKPTGFNWFSRPKNLNDAQDILLVEYLAHKHGNYPLLLHLNDSVIRYFLNQWVLRPNQSLNTKQQSFASIFFENHCKNEQFKQYMKNFNYSKEIIQFVISAIISYQKRILPSFQFIEPIYRITSKPLDLCDYLFQIAKSVRFTSSTSLIPIHIEFLIINNTEIHKPDPFKAQGVEELFESDDDDDDDIDIQLNGNNDDNDYNYNDESASDEEEDEYAIPRNIDKLLKSNKKRQIHIYPQPLDELNWNRLSKDIQEVVGGQEKRCRRVVFILDRRRKKDKLYLFKPVKCYKFNAKPAEIIHAALHYHTTELICPKPNGKEYWNARHGLKGQMLVMSYHVISKYEIRCYLFYEGQCFRFFGEDMINVLPSFFVDPEEAKMAMLMKYNYDKGWRNSFEEFCNTFKDTKFDSFYHGLTGCEARIDVIQNGN